LAIAGRGKWCAIIITHRGLLNIRSGNEGKSMCKCKCHSLPPEGKFVLQKSYEYSYIIDGVYVIDENNDQIYFSEIKWLWYFQKDDLD